MGQITDTLFSNLTDDARARPKDDPLQHLRAPKHDWPKGALVRNDNFKDLIFELLMRRARDFFHDMNMDNRPSEQRYVITSLKLGIWEKTLHPNNPSPPSIAFIDRDGTDLFPGGGIDPLISTYARVLVEDFDANHPDTVSFIKSKMETTLQLGCGTDP